MINKKILASFLIVVFFCEVALILGKTEETLQEQSSIKEIQKIAKLTEKIFGEKETKEVLTIQKLVPKEYCDKEYCYWEGLIVNEPCNKSRVCKKEGVGEMIFNLEEGFSDVIINNIKLDDNGKIYINDKVVFSKTKGCAVSYNGDINIEKYLKRGKNVIRAEVDNSCGLSMSALLFIKYKKDSK